MNKQNLTVAGVAVAIILAFVAFTNSGVPGQDGRDGKDGQSFAGQSGPDSSSPYISNNGVVTHFRSTAFGLGTSTLCVLPTGPATTTLVSFTGIPTTSTSTNVILVLENTSNPFAPLLATASSSVHYITSANIPSGTTNVFSTSSPTETGIVNNSVNALLAPNTYLTFYARTGGSGSITQAGTGNVFAGGRCKVVLQEI